MYIGYHLLLVEISLFILIKAQWNEYVNVKYDYSWGS